jgi:hypothetical protein
MKKFTFLKENTMIAAICCLLGILWTGVYLIDIRGLFGLNEKFLAGNTPNPFIFNFLFKNYGSVEHLQWIILLGCVFLCCSIHGREKTLGHKNAVKFFLILGIGLCVMVLEDAGDLRHNLSREITLLTRQVYGRNPAKILTEFGVYFLLGFLMVFPVVVYLKKINFTVIQKRYLFLGYLMYALVAVMSASRYLFNWYDKTGRRILNLLPIKNKELWTAVNEKLKETSPHPDPLGFWFMDSLIEESIELIAATCLLAFFLSVYRSKLTDKEPVPSGV